MLVSDIRHATEITITHSMVVLASSVVSAYRPYILFSKARISPVSAATDQPRDILSLIRPTGSTTDALMWCTIELNLGITGGCITAVRPFVRRYFPRLLGLSYGNGYKYGDSSRKYGHPLGSVPRANAPDFSNARSNQYSTLTTATTVMPAADNGSEEHILQYPEMPAKSADGIGIVRTVEFDVENSSARR